MITTAGQRVLEERIFQPGETEWSDVARRVADHLGHGEIEQQEFFEVLNNLEFLPNSPTLMNAGTDIHQYSACFVLPVEDDLESIFESVKNAALIHKTGGGTGFSFSRLRPKNSIVGSTNGVASGPVSFMRVFDAATEEIKQGGRRRGANMAVLRIDHPDIEEFITCKSDEKSLNNFNISVALTDKFMKAVDHAIQGGYDEFELICPTTGKVTEIVPALDLFNLICEHAHKNGEPGVLFIDEANRNNPTPELGDFESTNPCGEQWLLPYESCNLGSINLDKFIDYNGTVNFDRLQEVTRIGVKLLNRVLEMGKLPIPQVTAATNKTKKVGLGIMGLHDYLIKSGFSYDSDDGRYAAEGIMSVIATWAEGDGAYFDNKCVTSIQPTGSVSMIADCSSGCEPYFSIKTEKNVLGGTSLVNKHYEKLVSFEPAIWKSANEIHWADHIRMQAALQKYIDSSISKTINMANDATVQDVKDAYLLAWKMKCKGLTIYRDGSREHQVLKDTKQVSSTGTESEVDVVQGGCSKVKLPEVLDAKRFKLKGSDNEDIYIIVGFDHGNPLEVFAKFPYENQPDQMTKRVLWTTVCRLISLALRYGIELEEVVKQLDKSSGVINDLPSQLSKLLKRYNPDLAFCCPDCDSPEIEFNEGCLKCSECGWSKCS